jgi:phosphoserine phosphatase RsbU/P
VGTMRREDLWFATCLLAVVTIAVIDLVADVGNLTGSLTFVPFLASATCPPRRTMMVSGFSLAVGLVLVAIDSMTVTAALVRAAVLVAAALLAPLVAASRERHNRQLRQLIRVAEVAQLAVLTPVPPVAGPVALATAYRSASREALIGGDLYAVVERPSGVRIVVGDVRGKGLDAVQLAALVLSVFRETALAQSALVDVALATDARVSSYLRDEDFVTAVFADIDQDGHVEIVSCGHPPPVLVDAKQRALVDIAHPAAPLGLSPEPEGVHLRLVPGDRLLFYTDGLVETRSRKGGFVPLDALLQTLPTDPTDVALDRVLERLRRHAGDVRDDLALLLAEYVGPPVGRTIDLRGVARPVTPLPRSAQQGDNLPDGLVERHA